MKPAALVALVAMLGGPLAGQQPAVATGPAAGVVRGTVYDSIAHTPLAGARVEVASPDGSGPVLSAVSDSAGRFRIAGVPAGRFLVGFYHDALMMLGLDAPLLPLDVPREGEVTVALAIPSGAAVNKLACGGDPGARRQGMLAGAVRDGGSDSAVAGARIVVEWRALALEQGNYRTVTEQAAATVADDGTYRLCALPGDAALSFRVTAPGYYNIAGPVQVPTASVTRQDLRLVRASMLRGTASIRGRAMHENGKAVTSAHATIATLGRDVVVRDGSFAIADLPAGTWTIDVRAVGLEPQSTLAEAMPRWGGVTTVTLSDRPQQLEAVTIVGAPSRETKVLEDLLFRKKFGTGTVILPGNPFLASADRVTDVLRAARGFAPKPDGGWYGRAVPTVVCRAPGRCSIAPRCANVRVYLNGLIYPEGLDAISNEVRVRDIIGIEAYPDISFAPPLWRFMGGDSACAVVAFWVHGPP